MSGQDLLLPSTELWPHVGIPERGGVTTRFTLPWLPAACRAQSEDNGTHPPHGRPEALCQPPQAAQVVLETAQLQSRCLGSTAGTVSYLG